MDLIIFAKWILASVAQLGAGTGLDWPIMAPEVTAPARITHQLAAEDVWVPPVICPPGQPRCTPSPGGYVGGKLRQYFCLERGLYTFDLRVGMLPTGRTPADGKVWLVENASGARPTLLLEFSAEIRVATFQATSLGVAVETPTCFAIRYDSTGPARVSQDPRLTFLTIRG